MVKNSEAGGFWVKRGLFGGARDPFAETTKINSRKWGQGEEAREAREHLIAGLGLFWSFRAGGSAGGGTGAGGLSE
jgi:hypothetical protein